MKDHKIFNRDLSSYPVSRPRRLRQSEALRSLVKETHFTPAQLVMPFFVQPGRHIRSEIQAMPGQYRYSSDTLLKAIDTLANSGIRAVLLFGIPETKDDQGSEAWSEHGAVQNAIHEIKRHFPEICVISDVCLCAYTAHGHCGILNEKGQIENDPTLELLNRIALSHAEAGTDMVAPSDMMDGRVRSIRRTLDENDFTNTAILSYAVKYASAFYGPFRDAAHSSPGNSGTVPRMGTTPFDRKTYQMDPANLKEAIREAALDLEEGADILMVKPALAYLDVIREISNQLPVPLAAYSVSGEYLMAKSAAQSGFMDEKAVVLEMMNSIARAGAQILISYHAQDIADWLKP